MTAGWHREGEGAARGREILGDAGEDWEAAVVYQFCILCLPTDPRAGPSRGVLPALWPR
jgi:hypothetical protein